MAAAEGAVKRQKNKSMPFKLFQLLFVNLNAAPTMVGAGLAEDPRMLLTNMNTLLSKALDKY